MVSRCLPPIILWRHSSLQVHRPSRLRIGREPGRSFISLSRGFGSSIAPRLNSRHFQIHYLWTGSVEHADTHPAVSPTAIAFYSGGSGLLRNSDFIVSVMSQSISSLQLPSIGTLHPYISEPLSAAQDHNSTRTAIIFV